MPKQFVLLTTRVDQWKDYFNNLTNKVGDIDLLTTSGEFVSGSDSDLVTAINELDYRMDSVDALLDQAVKATSTVNFQQLTVGPWNDGTPTSTNPVFTATGLSTSNPNGYTVTASNGDITFDASADIVLDADDANVTIKDNGTTQFDFSNDGTDKTLNIPSGDLIITTGDDIILRPTGDDVFMQGVTSGEQLKFTLAADTQTIAASDALTLTGSTMTLDASGDIILDAAGANVVMKDNGTQMIDFDLTNDAQDITAQGALSINNAGSTTKAISLAATGGINISGASGEVDITATSGAVDVNASAAVTIDAGSTLTATGATGASVVATTNELDLTAASGAVDVNASTAVTIDAGTTLTATGATGASVVATTNELDLTATAANVDINAGTSVTVDASNGSITLTASDDIILDADSATIEFKAGGVSYLKFQAGDRNETSILSRGVEAIKLAEDSATITGSLHVEGALVVDGVVTFKAGSSGTVALGDENTDNVVFNADINSSIIPNTDNTYDLGSGSQEWKHLYLDGTAYVDNVAADSATITGDLDVQGLTTLDSATVDGWLTSSKIRAATGEALRLEADSGQDINLTAGGRLFGSFSAPDAGSDITQLIITNGSNDTMTLTAAGDLSLSGTGDFVPGATLNTTATKLAAAINEHEADIGTMSLDTTATDLTAAINEHEADIGTMSLDTTATDLTAAINEHEADIGDMSLNTAASNLTAAINEHEGDIGSMSLTTTATDLTAAINEIDSDLGNLSELTFLSDGDAVSNFAEAINFVHDRIPNIYDENDTLLN